MSCEAEASGPIPAKFNEAMRFMKNTTFLQSARHRSQQWRANRIYKKSTVAGEPDTLAHPDILEFEKRFIKRFKTLGIPMFAHCVMRTNEEQQRLKNLGHTKAGPGESPHNYACAIDLVHGTKAWNVPKPCWDLIGHIGKEVATQAGIKLVWGGDWKFYDPAHWELARWREERAL